MYEMNGAGKAFPTLEVRQASSPRGGRNLFL